MEWLKFLPVSMLYSVIAMLLLKLGNVLRNKDSNTTGSDDAFGNVLIAMAPAVAALEVNNETALRKALLTVYTTIGNYLKIEPGPK